MIAVTTLREHGLQLSRLERGLGQLTYDANTKTWTYVVRRASPEKQIKGFVTIDDQTEEGTAFEGDASSVR